MKRRHLPLVVIASIIVLGGFAVAWQVMHSHTAQAATRTFYIAASGSDANNGTSKSTPWAHVPGMPNCTGTCAATTPQPGDSYILKGCDTWGNASFPISWDWSGTSASRIYIGVDKTWYNSGVCPSGWNRPIMNAGDASIGGFGWMMIMGPNSNTAY